MDPEEKLKEGGGVKPVFRRPVLLTAICLAAFVHFGLLSVLFLLATLQSGWITEVANRYLETDGYTSTRLPLLFGAGFLLHSLAFTGFVLVWKLRRKGYYLLGLSILVITIFQLFNPLASVGFIGVYITFLVLTGIFYSKMQ